MIEELMERSLCGNCIHMNREGGVCLIKPSFNENGTIKDKRARVDLDTPGCADFNQIEEANLLEVYRNIIDILKEYCDLKEEYYNIISLWIIGTYFHDCFPTYPYLFLNATKGSGKTRLLKLITTLANEGEILNSLTEAVLFRTTGTLAIDEFEGVMRKGKESLIELLNSAYKRGTKVKRMQKKKTIEGEQQVVEEFDVYRPLLMANIAGIGTVLGDRCIQLIIEKSGRKDIINLIELFDDNHQIQVTQNLLKEVKQCRLCRCRFSVRNIEKWNEYVKFSYNNDTVPTNNTNNINNINSTPLFESIKNSNISGRDLELSFPLIMVAQQLNDENVLKTTLKTLSKISRNKSDEELIENSDNSLLDFVSQLSENTTFLSMNELVKRFKEFLQSHEDWINSKWMGRAFKRLDLVVESRRKSFGREVRLNIPKAQRKIRMLK